MLVSDCYQALVSKRINNSQYNLDNHNRLSFFVTFSRVHKIVGPKRYQVRCQENAWHTTLWQSGNTMLIKVKTLTGRQIELDVEPTDTILQVKEKIEEKQGIPPEQQRIIYGGKPLNDDKQLQEYRIESGCIIHLILALRGGV